MIFGGTNSEIDLQFIYKVNLKEKNSYLISELETSNNEKSCLYNNKVLIFGVKIVVK